MCFQGRVAKDWDYVARHLLLLAGEGGISQKALWPVRENKKERQTGDIVGGDRMNFSQDPPSF